MWLAQAAETSGGGIPLPVLIVGGIILAGLLLRLLLGGGGGAEAPSEEELAALEAQQSRRAAARADREATYEKIERDHAAEDDRHYVEDDEGD